MRSRVPLVLIEQTLLLLVFALAAVLCLEVFVWCEKASSLSAEKDWAAVEAQTAAEILKSTGGDWDRAATLGDWTPCGDGWTVFYDGDGGRTAVATVYTLTVRPQKSGMDNLGQGAVTVTGRGGEPLFSLPVCWQEGMGHD